MEKGRFIKIQVEITNRNEKTNEVKVYESDVIINLDNIVTVHEGKREGRRIIKLADSNFHVVKETLDELLELLNNK